MTGSGARKSRSVMAGLFAIGLGLLPPVPALAQTPDLFAPRAGLDADTALYLDAWSGDADSVERLRARLDRAPAPANAHRGWSFLCGLAFQRAQYARAMTDCQTAIALNPEGGDANTLAIVRLLLDQPSPRAHGSARVPVTQGVRVPVAAGAYDGVALADTGAEISVMMQSVADAAQVRMLGDSRDVGSPTASVSGEIGLIPEVKIGDAVVENIPVLVLPDARLTVTDGEESVSLPFILSLYALAEFGRIAWLDHGAWFALGDAAPAPFPGAAPMIWHPNGIAVPLEGTNGRLAAHFDSGANASELYDNAAPLLSDAERASIVSARRTIAGLGAIIEQEVRRVPQASLVLADQPLILRNLDIADEPRTGEAARLGEDVLQAYSAVVFDFQAMTFSISP